jgi:hypothetical protein
MGIYQLFSHSSELLDLFKGINRTGLLFPKQARIVDSTHPIHVVVVV